MTSGAYLLDAGLVPYGEALELQHVARGAVSQRAIPDTVVLLEHPPVVTTGRRTEEGGAPHPRRTPRRARRDEPRRQVDLPRSGTARLLSDPRPQPARQGPEALRPRPRGGDHPDRSPPFGLEATTIEGLTGVWLPPQARGPRKIASIGVHVSRWVTTHGYALNVDLDPGAVHRVDHRLRARRCGVHDDGAGARPRPSPSTRSSRQRSPRSARSSGSSSTSCRPTTAPASGRSRCTRSSPHDEPSQVACTGRARRCHAGTTAGSKCISKKSLDAASVSASWTSREAVP